MPCSHLPPADRPDPLRVEDAHLTETVLLLARGIAADLGFDRLPILADALEDTGCDNFALLNHLRNEPEHRVECWALRRLLRTTLMLPGNVPITFAYCPPGTFLMGSDRLSTEQDAKPAHRVTLTRGFHTGIWPVTQRQWRAVMGTTLTAFQEDEQPVAWVDWNSALSFCEEAQRTVGRSLRLPTEAEWEYACRAGTTTDYYFGDSIPPHLQLAFPVGPDGWSTRTVGFSPANPWGLFDFHGNAWEWCSDWYDAEFYLHSPEQNPECQAGERSQKVVRGGRWPDGHIRIAPDRGRAAPAWQDTFVSFRVVFTAT